VSEQGLPLQQFVQQCGQGVVEVEHAVLGSVKRVPHLKHDHPPVNNVNEQVTASFSLMERVALFITERVGSFGFFLLIVAWSSIWLLWNTHAPKSMRFDPAPAFVIWLFISNLIQLSLLPLIMVGQNLLSRHSELRSEEDFRINQKAEQEARAILLHLEHQTAQIERQGELILEIFQRLEKSETAGGATAEWKAEAVMTVG
jgi:uncharacterized membrane protein